ncbi:MAG TPA: chromate transporter [Gallicola sp.]|nr:chromate transporter [Gallicola sp.]
MNNIIFILFFTFLRIGTFSIGGGYAIIPLIQDEVVSSKGWLTLKEYTDIITISQMTPGPLVVNTASFVGIRVAGTFGAVVATLGSILSGFIISILLYNFFKKNKNIDGIANILKGLRSSSVGLIASATTTIIILTFFGPQPINFGNANINVSAVIIFFVSLFLLRKHKLNPILIIIFTGAVGLFIY